MSRGSGKIVDRFAPGLAALARYDRTWLRYDLVAGISVAAVAAPIAIAYAQLAGVPAVYGIYASILPLVAYAVFGTSRQLIMAPDAATCTIAAAITIPLAGGDPARQVSLTMALAVTVGLICVAAGLARLGFLTSFLARPILTGYLNGIAISIISGQLGNLFGIPVKRAGFFRQVADFLSKLDQTHVLTLAAGLAVFAGLYVLKRRAPRFPAPLLAVALGIAASDFWRFGERGVALLGAIPAGLPALRLPDIGPADLQPLAFGAVGLALVSFNSAMVTARGFAAKNRYEIDPNQEFIALGMADIGAGVLQGFAVSGADSRTAVNDAVGGKSQVTSLVAAVLLVLMLMCLTGPLSSLPVVVLASVLVHSAIGLFDFPSLVRLRKISRKEFRLSIVTLLGVITVGVLPGVVVAVGLALLQLLAKASRPHDAVLGRASGLEGYRDARRNPEARTLPGLVLFRFDSPLVFFNADYFRSRIRAAMDAEKTPPRCVVLDAESISGIDSTGAAILEEVAAEMAGKGVAFAIAEAHAPLRDMLDRSGLGRRISSDRFFSTVEAAVSWAMNTGAAAFIKHGMDRASLS